MNIVIPMAGRGMRTNDYTSIPKPLIEISGKTMIRWVVESLNIKGNYIFITRKYEYDKWNIQLNEELLKLIPNAEIIEIDYVTEGPAASVLIAKKHINNDDSLIVANCDQIMQWDSTDFVKQCQREDLDGVVVTQCKQTIKNSYIAINDNGYGTLLKEKEIISTHALTGLHFWKRGRDYVISAEIMIKDNIRFNNEFYISLSYNILINQGHNIGIYEINLDQNWPTGTTEDILNFLKNFKYEKV